MSIRNKVQAVSCPTCGAKTVEYRHRLSLGIVGALVKLYEKAGIAPFQISILDLSHSQMANFQKLRYWGLVQKSSDTGDRKGGFWAVTPLGGEFVLGKKRIREIALTYRATVQGTDGKAVAIFEIIEGYQYRGDFQDQIKEAGADTTPTMI